MLMKCILARERERDRERECDKVIKASALTSRI